MAGRSNIEWCTDTWNPIVGCSITSPGCTNCYAMRMADRIEAMVVAHMGAHGDDPGPMWHYEGTTTRGEFGGKPPVWTGKVALAPDTIVEAPLRWRKPRRIFVNSMSDLFHEAIPDAWIDRIFAIMALCPQHTFQVLTKRSRRMRAYLSAARAHPVGMAAFDQTLRSMAMDPGLDVGKGVTLKGDIPHLKVWPLANAWLGVSTEDQRRADERVPDLLATPAAVRFVSAEPLLGPLDMTRWLAIDWQCSYCREFFTGRHRPACLSCGKEGGWTGSHAFNGRHQPKRAVWPIDRGSGLDWVIVGGESGPGARPMHPDWARSLRDQCAAAGVPFHFKQWGAWRPGWSGRAGTVGRYATHWPFDVGRWNYFDRIPTPFDSFGIDAGMSLVGKSASGRLLDGVEHNGMPGGAA